ncbi:radical SAM additional 4Fe4S-binding SPASM domain-containing protein [Cnuella takakiae]|uniref:Radical SAM additional 4Fe4S-binding SPASM domain-containing protein n=1 Tax=Cnuella takakiae TaxID=1302690 RepID=A0A1M5GVJ6_9BACT|nr:radical SAM/SPASM domain-containing protein [Cnuella takakiae]OLY90872.1 radical SAM protein [Cnuella takakiae]SHG07723.1 radical SAM additional 4Fe4S-binding SPASM domain-containing protein [Cnuella takakiae]
MSALWNDRLNFLSKLTLRRVANMTKVWASYHCSKWSGKAVQWGMPVSIAFEPTTSCNLRCPECPSGLRAFSRPTGMLQPRFFQATINDLAPDISYLVFYFQGEPYLNPAFLDMVHYAAAKKIYTATSTNAHYLTDSLARRTVESGLDRLVISIDGATQQTYQQYRVGGKLDKVLEGTANILKWKKELGSKTPLVVWQFLVVRHNEHEIPAIRQMAKESGVDAVWFKTAQVYDFENDPNGLIPNNNQYSRYRRNASGLMVFKGNNQRHCWRLWHAPVITWDGAVVPCCFDKDAQHTMGSLQQQSFRELWQSGLYQKFRAKVLRSRSEVDICTNCSEGVQVWG